MGTELPKTQDSSGDSDSNSESEHSSTSDSSGSDWECSDAKQSSTHKPHFSVTSSDTGLKLKIAAIPPRKTATKKVPNPPTVKKKTSENTKTLKSLKDRPGVKKKVKSQLSESTSSSESCSKCSSDSSSEDDLPLKTVSKLLPKGSTSKISARNTKTHNLIKSDSDEETGTVDSKDNVSKINVKDKNSVSKTNNNTVKKNKSDESSQESNVKRGRGRPRTKIVSCNG